MRRLFSLWWCRVSPCAGARRMRRWRRAPDSLAAGDRYTGAANADASADGYLYLRPSDGYTRTPPAYSHRHTRPGDSGPHLHTWADGHAHANGHVHPHADADTAAWGAHPHADAQAHPHTDTDGYTDPYPLGYTYATRAGASQFEPQQGQHPLSGQYWLQQRRGRSPLRRKEQQQRNSARRHCVRRRGLGPSRVDDNQRDADAEHVQDRGRRRDRPATQAPGRLGRGNFSSVRQRGWGDRGDSWGCHLGTPFLWQLSTCRNTLGVLVWTDAVEPCVGYSGYTCANSSRVSSGALDSIGTLAVGRDSYSVPASRVSRIWATLHRKAYPT